MILSVFQIGENIDLCREFISYRCIMDIESQHLNNWTEVNTVAFPHRERG